MMTPPLTGPVTQAIATLTSASMKASLESQDREVALSESEDQEVESQT